MIICIASHKGGVGKTTVAINLGAYLNQFDPVLVVDGDPNRSATDWARRGNLPFKVVDERQAIKYARDYRHVVIDMLAIIGKRIFLDFRRPATGHANLVSGVGSAEMDRSSG